MIHYTCDLCGKRIDKAKAGQYLVKIEIRPNFDPDWISEDDLDEDHLEAVARSLQRDPDDPDLHHDDDQDQDLDNQSLRFDLCSHCQRKYARDPLGKTLTRGLGFFSAN